MTVTMQVERGSNFARLSQQIRRAGLLDRRPGYYAVRISLVAAAYIGGWVAFAAIGASWWVLVAAVVIGLDLLAGRNEPIRPARRGVALAAGVIAFDIVVSFVIGATLVGFAGLAVAGIMALGLWLLRRSLEVTA